MKGREHTDVLLNVENLPFITCTEGKIPNAWYTEGTDKIFALTAHGFRMCKVGSKKIILKQIGA